MSEFKDPIAGYFEESARVISSLSSETEKIKEIAVSAFSPPESRLIDESFLPGGRA